MFALHTRRSTMQTLSKVILSSLMATIVSTSSLAATASPSGANSEKAVKKHMEKRDVNKDGVISQAEFLAHASASFAKIDVDGDGEITKDEAKIAHMKMKKKRKNKAIKKSVKRKISKISLLKDEFDANEDGELSSEEFQTAVQTRVAKMNENFVKTDSNGDGFITGEEMEVLAEKIRFKGKARIEANSAAN